jgi:cyclohexadienyl dehydratase
MLSFPMGIRRLARLFSLLALLGASAAATAGPGVLRVGTSGDYAPFSSLLPGEPPSYEGFDVAMARAYAQERGLALELVEFRWPQLVEDLRAGRFDVAMSGVTVRPRRSVAGRFSVPVAQSGAVMLLRDPEQFSTLEELDQRALRIGVHAGGHLEQVARAHFSRATLIFIPENAAVLDALLGYSVDAALTDTLEAPLWQSLDPELGLLGPFTRDRKAYLVRAERSGLAADLDAWLLARERDGSLARLRRRYLGEKAAAPTVTPLGALVAALDERLALMPWVAAAKRRDVLPIADPARETKVIEAALAGVRAAVNRSHAAPPPDEVVRAFFRAQIDAARQVQLAAGRDASYRPEEPIPDLQAELRPALLRIGERIAALLLTLPEGLDAAEARRAIHDGLRSPWLQENTRRALADALTTFSKQPRLATEAPTEPPVTQ